MQNVGQSVALAGSCWDMQWNSERKHLHRNFSDLDPAGYSICTHHSFSGNRSLVKSRSFLGFSSLFHGFSTFYTTFSSLFISFPSVFISFSSLFISFSSLFISFSSLSPRFSSVIPLEPWPGASAPGCICGAAGPAQRGGGVPRHCGRGGEDLGPNEGGNTQNFSEMDVIYGICGIYIYIWNIYGIYIYGIYMEYIYGISGIYDDLWNPMTIL